MDVFNLVATLALDRSEYDSGLDDAGKEASSFGSKISGGLQKAGKIAAVGLGAIATGAGVAVGALQKGAAEVAEYGDHIDKMSQKLGISAEAYQEWDAILQHSGASIDSMQGSLKTLQLAVENGDDAFQKLGITQEQLASMSTEELFAETIRGLQGMEEGSERTALATQLLGRGAMEMGALLNTSAEETEAMRQRVHELGGVMSDEAVKSAAAYQDSLQDMKTSMSGLKNSLLTSFLPGITRVMDGLTAIFSGDSEGGIAMIKDGIDSVLDAITDKLPDFISRAGDIINAIVSALIDNLPSILSSGGQIVGELIAGLIAAIPKLLAAVPQIIAGIIKGLSNAWPDIRAAGEDIITGIKEGISGAWHKLTDLMSEKFRGIKEFFRGVVDDLKNLFNFDFTLPKIKLPHFTWSWNDLGLLKVPNIGVEWYAKAYETPYMFSKPTLMGFGDGAGDEMVYGKNALMDDIRRAVSDVSDRNGGEDGVFNIVVQSILDGRIVSESVARYQRSEARAAG